MATELDQLRQQVSEMRQREVEFNQLKTEFNRREEEQRLAIEKLRLDVDRLEARIPASEEEEDESYEEEESDEDMDIDSDTDIPEAIWDDIEHVFRCASCTWEVADTYCVHCGIEHSCVPPEGVQISNLKSTHSSALHVDRTPIPRGTTPIRSLTAAETTIIPPSYTSRAPEFRALLARGCPRAMCEAFQLEFSDARGIVAHADWELVKMFWDERKIGDVKKWKIQLGRRVEVDEDDEDGAYFLEGLIEDGMLYSVRWPWDDVVWPEEMWETIEESPGEWITRMKAPADQSDMPDTTHSGQDKDDEMYENGILDDEWWDERSRRIEDLHVDEPVGPIIDLPYEEDANESVARVENAEEVERMQGDSGWAIQGNVRDGLWPPDDEMQDDSSDEEYEPGAEPTGLSKDSPIVIVDPTIPKPAKPQLPLGYASEDSEVDSDFDENETMSGDEDLVSYTTNLLSRPKVLFELPHLRHKTQSAL